MLGVWAEFTPVAGDHAERGSFQLLLGQSRVSRHDVLGGDQPGAGHPEDDIADAAGLGRTYNFTHIMTSRARVPGILPIPPANGWVLHHRATHRLKRAIVNRSRRLPRPISHPESEQWKC